MSTDTQISPQVGKDFDNKNVSEQMRIVRGYAIISKGDTPKRVGKESYSVPSQNGNGDYTVTKNGKWECTCPDFQGRNKECKHIHAVKFFLSLKAKVRDEIERDRPHCPYCKSDNVIKFGVRFCKDRMKQRYGCKDCDRKFIQEKDFAKFKGDAKVTTVILDLFFKGISLRKISDHLRQFYFLSIDASNIYRRIIKFSTVINDYVKDLQPEVSHQWHTDEMKIQAGGKWRWLWNVMDKETRFLITRKVTDMRRIKDSVHVLCKAKETAGKEPVFLITDGCVAYSESIKRSLPKTHHVRLTSIRDKRVNNNNVERLNGTIRERIKVMRGLHSTKTADVMMQAYGNYYNFVRVHSSLGCTPAEKAGINAPVENNCWMHLLTNGDGDLGLNRRKK